MDPSAFAADVAETATINVVRQVQVPGIAQPLQVMVLERHARGPCGTPLVVCFHGAIDQTKRRVPAFEGRFLLINGLKGLANIVSIADPSLALHSDLKAAWYAGNSTSDTPSAIAALVSALVERLAPSRIVFVGGSTGAHPALVQSFRVPGSVAVVENPILHISAYNPRHINEYRRFCWPRLGRAETLPASVGDNVAHLYSKGHANTVVLLNNARDPHFWVQAAEFLNAVRRGDGRHRCLLSSEFYPDYPGHSFPAAVWARWVSAACSAATAATTDIGTCHGEILSAAASPVAVPAESARTAPRQERGPSPPTPADIELAQRIYGALMARGSDA